MSAEAQGIRLYLAERQKNTWKLRTRSPSVDVDPSVARSAGGWNTALPRCPPGRPHNDSSCCQETPSYHLADQRANNVSMHRSGAKHLTQVYPPSGNALSFVSSSKSPNSSPRSLPALPASSAAKRDKHETLFHFYSSAIVPFAKSFSLTSYWPAHAGHIENSPMLSFAIVAYASAFLRLLCAMAKSLPVNSTSSTNLLKFSLMYVQHDERPCWRRLQGEAVSHLLEGLNSSRSSQQRDCAGTSLMLMRLALLIGDEEMAQAHHEGLKSMMELHEKIYLDLSADLQMWNMDLVRAYVEQLCDV